jgi:hypothetical protein
MRQNPTFYAAHSRFRADAPTTREAVS